MKISKKKSDPWEERQLGADAEFVSVADESHEIALNDALELQAELAKPSVKDKKAA